MALFSKSALLALLTLCLGFSVLSAQPAHAADAKPNFVVIDIDALIAESEAGKSIEDQFKKSRDAFQQEFSKKEAELGQTEKSIISQKNDLSVEELAKKRKAFESDLLETRKLFQKRRNALDKGLAEAMKELRSQIVKASADEAEQKGYHAVFLRESVVIVEKELDITKQVLDRLNAQVKSIPVKVE